MPLVTRRFVQLSVFIVILSPITGKVFAKSKALEIEQNKAPAGEWSLTEASLLAAIQENPPEIDRLMSVEKQADLNASQVEEPYGVRWQSQIRHQNSKEKALASFIPTFGPTYRFETGLSKQFKTGMELSAGVFTDQQSSADKVIDAATRTGLQVGLTVDLWKNFLGRLDTAQVQEQSLAREREHIQAHIARRVFELNLRKDYWSLVANNEQRLISEELLRISEKQLREGKRRAGNYIADQGEIARYRAQVASRRSTLLSLEYQRDLIIRSIKEALPNIASAHFNLGPYDREQKVAEVLACVARIEKTPAIPWDFTKWDEAIALLDREYKHKKTMTNRYSGPDVTFQGNLQASGVDKGFDDSVTDFVDSPRLGYDVAFMVDVPLGDPTRTSKKAQVEADYYAFNSDRNRILGQIKASHGQIVSLVTVLKESVQRLKENNNNLRISINEMEKKFKQARASVNEVIQDQDSLLTGLLTEVDANLRVIHTLLDYFMVFTDDPCTVNQLTVKS